MTKVQFLWIIKHQHHLMWPWCAAVTADTARPVLQASVTLCCCMYDTSERLFSIHVILAYGNVLEGWSPLELKRTALRTFILDLSKIFVSFIVLTDLSTISKYFIVLHHNIILIFLFWKHTMSMWGLKSRNLKVNLKIFLIYLDI